MNSYEYLLKTAGEQMGYRAQPQTEVVTRQTSTPGAPALPPAPSSAPVSAAPPPSPKMAGIRSDIEKALHRRRQVQLAKEWGLTTLADRTQQYQDARNKVLKTVGLPVLGAGLGGLALYGLGKHLLQRRAEQDPPRGAEDFSAASE